ncbi:CCA tRNA nucleotidyltransferase [Rhodobacterales bacterium HKCCE2091]|nr:CCA tRNA nucleotidyltransferase [Rhodobacterales bacterium HKCCE2091]
MKLQADWLRDPGTAAVMRMLTGAGHQAYFVGGCVRDELLGRDVGDIDISTDARPETVMKLAERAGLKPVGTGVDHGTVTVVAEGQPHEVTTFRRDVETDGRRAVVAFSDRIEEDAARRDFTMNALYADSTGEVLDPTGEGLSDLSARRLRFIGRPEDRIREDYLRALRFFRFSAWFGDPDAGFDPDALAAISTLNSGLETLSRERVGHEMRKLLAAPDPAPAVGGMARTGVLPTLLPGAETAALAPLVHLEAEQRIAPDWLRRLAALNPPEATERLRLSRPEGRRLDTILNAVGTAAGPGELGYRHGADIARDILLLRAASLSQPVPPGALAQAETGAAATFPLRAADLPDGVTGPEIGRMLADRESRWIASGFTATREDLLG